MSTLRQPYAAAQIRLTRLLAATVAFIAGVVLIGWATGIEVLTRLSTASTSMKPNTALCLLVLAMAPYIGVRGPRARLVAIGGVVAVGLLAMATLLEMLLSADWGVDQLLPWLDVRGNAQMAPATAVALLALTLAGVAAGLRRLVLTQVLGLAGFAVGYLALVGYAFAAEDLYEVSGYSSVSPPTALCLALIGLAAISSHPGHGLPALLSDPGSAGHLSRRLVPFLFLGPPALGWLRLRGQDAGWYSTSFGVAILVVTLTTSGLALLLLTACEIRDAERRRASAEEELSTLNEHLEEVVQTRTQELSTARARFAAAFASSPLGTALTGLDGVVQEANRLLPGLTNTRAADLVGVSVDDLFDDERTHEDAALRSALLAGHGQSYQLERRLRRIGATCWVQVSVALVQDHNGPRGLLFQLEDVTHRKLAEQRAQHLALHDSLTSLPNRLLLLDRLQQALAQANRTGRGVGALFIDLDRFKFVNDTLGHEAGDLVLAEVAHRLRRSARAGDTVARLGGDEFVVICPDVGSERDVLQVASVLREAVAHPIEVPGGQAVVDASIGIAFGVGHDDPELLLRQADQAMYRAKDRGRARYEVFDDDLRSRINHRLETELSLRGATDRGELETWYQPIVSLATGGIVATEALARWRRPGRGLVEPSEFIQVAEEVGLIRELGTAILRQACSATAEEGRHAVSVNVSARQFVRADFQAVVEETLALTGLPADRLWLELTESAVVEAIDSAARSFQALRDRGVRIAIDDFGTGFSSFAHLKGFSVDLVKIDRAFVRDLLDSEHDLALVSGMVDLAHALHLEVVAEGVETTGQRDLLRRLGCDYAQGFLFAAPSPIASPQVRPLATPVPQPRPEHDGLAPDGPKGRNRLER